MNPMEGIPDINRNQSAPETPAELSTISPPPTEVKIRTMKSDIARLASSGGGLPQFENVRVAGSSLEKRAQSTEETHKSNALAIALITLIALAILVALGYVGYQILTKGSF